MTTPIRINCQSETKIPLEKIRAMANLDQHVVLQFPLTQHVDKCALISKLGAALPEHAVFDSGGDRATDWVTVMPVVTREQVLAHTREIGEAVTRYIGMCATMLAIYQEGSLSTEWSSYVHGEYRRFENSHTGQVIEAPLDGVPEPQRVDPYFFALFAKSTPGFEVVAGLLKHDFHDAARILDILFSDAICAQEHA